MTSFFNLPKRWRTDLSKKVKELQNNIDLFTHEVEQYSNKVAWAKHHLQKSKEELERIQKTYPGIPLE